MSARESHLVIGSGPSAAVTALTLSARPDQHVTILDIGGRLEAERRDTVARLSVQDESAWRAEDIELISARTVAPVLGVVPQKRTYGSDYPFRNLGQTTGIDGRPSSTNLDVTSSAYGGFSNVWGAQVMPFSRSTFARWPVSWPEMEPHYRAVLDEVPLTAEVDDLAELFPLVNPRSGLPPLGPRATDVLHRYERHREALRSHGVIVGRARLALAAEGCTRCGLCMTGCPYSLIYSATQTMDKVRLRPDVEYHDRLLVERIGQDGDQVFARCRDLATGERHEFRADRLFVGAGALGSTRLVLGSLPSPPPSIDLAEAAQFIVPFLSARAVEDPRRPGTRDFALNQFNVLLNFDDDGYNSSHVHCYPYNPAFFDALPAPLRRASASSAATQVLRRLTVGFGYLPSWASPAIRVTHRRNSQGGLPDLDLTPSVDQRPPMLGKALRRLVRAAPRLDLWPLLTHVRLSGAGKSYHVGGAFPHRGAADPTSGSTTDRWGRLPDWDRIHLVDGSVLPSIAATTFTLTVMANAHRITSEVLAAAREPSSRSSAR